MVLFSIPDIRLFWTDDERFHAQFPPGGEIVEFKPYSKYPPVHKDVTFWLPEGGASDCNGGWEGGQGDATSDKADVRTFHENDLSQLVRDTAGDLVEKVTLLDEFTHPKTGTWALAPLCLSFLFVPSFPRIFAAVPDWERSS